LKSKIHPMLNGKVTRHRAVYNVIVLSYLLLIFNHLETIGIMKSMN
jgi:hypothetical protein